MWSLDAFRHGTRPPVILLHGHLGCFSIDDESLPPLRAHLPPRITRPPADLLQRPMPSARIRGTKRCGVAGLLRRPRSWTESGHRNSHQFQADKTP